MSQGRSRILSSKQGIQTNCLLVNLLPLHVNILGQGRSRILSSKQGIQTNCLLVNLLPLSCRSSPQSFDTLGQVISHNNSKQLHNVPSCPGPTRAGTNNSSEEGERGVQWGIPLAADGTGSLYCSCSWPLLQLPIPMGAFP